MGNLREGKDVIIHSIEERDLREALEVANYAYQGNLRFKEGPEPISASGRSWGFGSASRTTTGRAIDTGCLGRGGTRLGGVRR